MPVFRSRAAGARQVGPDTTGPHEMRVVETRFPRQCRCAEPADIGIEVTNLLRMTVGAAFPRVYEPAAFFRRRQRQWAGGRHQCRLLRQHFGGPDAQPANRQHEEPEAGDGGHGIGHHQSTASRRWLVGSSGIALHGRRDFGDRFLDKRPIDRGRAGAPRAGKQADQHQDEPASDRDRRQRAHEPVRLRHPDRLEPGRAGLPELALHKPGNRQVDHHDRDAKQEQPVGPLEGFRVITRSRDALPRMDNAAYAGEACKAQHREVGMRDNPVREVDGLVERHLRLRRALHADDHVEDDGHRYEAQRDFFGYESGAALRQHQVGDHQYDDNAQQRRGGNRSELRLHRDDRIDVVVSPVQRVPEEQAPEPQHGQEMAENGPARRGRDDEVEDR